ncbi:MAG: DUF1824 family protein [Cyanobium sp.]
MTISCLDDLRRLRQTPPLDSAQRLALRAELEQQMASCAWFTIGVMAPSEAEAITVLQRWEQALGWVPLAPASAPEPAGAEGATNAGGGVFLKGHQRNGSFWLRREAGLAEGVLISGHHDSDQPDLGDTWGPLPSDLY